jgi:hypothetical protein
VVLSAAHALSGASMRPRRIRNLLGQPQFPGERVAGRRRTLRHSCPDRGAEMPAIAADSQRSRGWRRTPWGPPVDGTAVAVSRSR